MNIKLEKQLFQAYGYTCVYCWFRIWYFPNGEHHSNRMKSKHLVRAYVRIDVRVKGFGASRTIFGRIFMPEMSL